MATEEHPFDLIVIGSGPGGYSAAIRAAQKKLRVAIVEKDKLGGTCLNRGCIPTKALLHDAILISRLRHLPYLKGPIEYSFQDVIDRKNEVVARSVKGLEALFLNQGVELIKGDALAKTSQSVQIRTSEEGPITLKAGHIVLATGIIFQYPEPLRVDGERVMGTTQALDLEEPPERLAVIGGDYKGVEFATLFQCLGSDVILIEKERRIIPSEDHEMSSRLKQVLATRMKIMTRAEVAKVEERNQRLVLTVETQKGSEEVIVDKVIVTGQGMGSLDRSGLEGIDLSLRDGFIEVGPTMETSVKNIFAVGDMVGGPLYAHKALAQGVRAVGSILGNRNERSDIIPRVIFTDPQIGAVGLTQREAEEREGPDGVLIGKFPIEVSGRAMTLAEPKGNCKVVAEKRYGEVLGVHVFGPHATELVALACLAMKNELGIHELREAVFAHPTLTETFHEAVLNIWGEAIHFYAEP